MINTKESQYENTNVKYNLLNGLLKSLLNHKANEGMNPKFVPKIDNKMHAKGLLNLLKNVSIFLME